MEKRVVLAMVLSLAILLGWTMLQAQFAPPPQPTPTDVSTGPAGQPPAPADGNGGAVPPGNGNPPPPAVVEDLPEATVEYENEGLRLWQ